MKCDDFKAARDTAYTAAWEQAQSLLSSIKEELDYEPPPFDGITWAQLAHMSRMVDMLRRTYFPPEDE